MGIGQKLKDALHSDSPNKTSTYEHDKPPGSFPSETTSSKHNRTTDGRDYTTTDTTAGTGLSGRNTTTAAAGGTGHHSPTSNIHGGATGDPTGASKTGHRPTDSGVDVGARHNRTGEQGTTTQTPYWGSVGRESHGVTGSPGTSGLTSSNACTGHDDPSGTHGPHGNRAENLADPRVDSDRDHRGAPGTGMTGSNVRTGYDDPSGTHGLHSGRTGNVADPRVDSDRDHRGAPGAGLTGSNVHSGYNDRSNVPTGYDDPSGIHGPHNTRAANAADPRVDSDRDHRGAPYGANKDLPLRPNEQYGYGSRGQGPEAFGGGTYNPLAPAGHHDPASGVDRTIEGRDLTHTGHGGNMGPGAGTQAQYGMQNPVQNPSLIGATNDDPSDTRMRDRDMGRDRTGHGLAGGVAGAGLGAAAAQTAHRHHHDDLRDSGYGASNTGGAYNSPLNTRGGGVGGVDDSPRSGSGLAGHEPGVPKTSMLDPYNDSPNTHGVGADKGMFGGRNGSPPFHQGSLASNSMSTGMGPDHYGPAHEGAKVMHTCSHCGRDNDISRYFKKDAVYRMK